MGRVTWETVCERFLSIAQRFRTAAPHCDVTRYVTRYVTV